MSNWKFTDTTNQIVFRTLDNGVMESRLASTLSTEELAIVTPANPVIEPTLDELRAEGCAKIDKKAFEVRCRFITPNKDATYLAKSSQVDSYIAAGYPVDLTDYGYIKAEVSRLGLDLTVPADLKTAADGLKAIRNAWLNIDYLIEETTLTAKASVMRKLKASTIGDVVYDTLVALDGIK